MPTPQRSDIGRAASTPACPPKAIPLSFEVLVVTFWLASMVAAIRFCWSRTNDGPAKIEMLNFFFVHGVDHTIWG
jgi:hypothetical protein